MLLVDVAIDDVDVDVAGVIVVVGGLIAVAIAVDAVVARWWSVHGRQKWLVEIVHGRWESSR